MRVRTLHEIDQAKLTRVVAEMRVLGAPELVVLPRGWGIPVLVSGTHRAAAATQLGLRPRIRFCDGRDVIEHGCAADDIASSAYGEIVEIEEDG
jgi:hypothetical protein